MLVTTRSIIRIFRYPISSIYFHIFNILFCHSFIFYLFFIFIFIFGGTDLAMKSFLRGAFMGVLSASAVFSAPMEKRPARGVSDVDILQFALTVGDSDNPIEAPSRCTIAKFDSYSSNISKMFSIRVHSLDSQRIISARLASIPNCSNSCDSLPRMRKIMSCLSRRLSRLRGWFPFQPVNTISHIPTFTVSLL